MPEAEAHIGNFLVFLTSVCLLSPYLTGISPRMLINWIQHCISTV